MCLFVAALAWPLGARAERAARGEGPPAGGVTSAASPHADTVSAQAVNDWNALMAELEPLSGFFMHTRLGALLHVAMHDAINASPKAARYRTYLPPVPTQGRASPRAALAAAAHTMLTKYIALFSDPTLPPPFYRPDIAGFAPQVDALYAAQLAGIAPGLAKKGIALGKQTATTLWNLRLGDGWNNPAGLAFEFPNNDGDGDPTTGLPGDYALLDPADTFPGAPQPYFFWWGEMTPWTMASNDQFLSPPPPAPDDPAFRQDLEEVRLYAEDDSAVRTPEQTFAALWWEFCPGSGLPAAYTFTRQLVTDFALDGHDAARVFALVTLAQADAMISNVNSKNVYQFWRPITAINFSYPGSGWKPFMLTPPNQEYPAGHPMVSGAALHMLIKFFGPGQLPRPLVGTSQCGDLLLDSLADGIENVIDARVWGGQHFRGSGEVGSQTGEQIVHHVHENFLNPL
ncbi:MAG TPA: vanadium-dependent haloperoxidase [Polyangiaceae bacterium]|nr:vanadium-dependent haloperoxidase [Polyangiaceae bacterium]